jgi:hypothetical protein
MALLAASTRSAIAARRTPVRAGVSRAGNPRAAVVSRRTSVQVNAGVPLVGSKAPDFTATAVFDQEFQEVSLASYKGKKYVVLFFYPLDFTFVCESLFGFRSARGGGWRVCESVCENVLRARSPPAIVIVWWVCSTPPIDMIERVARPDAAAGSIVHLEIADEG